jgi:hypothetical protein
MRDGFAEAPKHLEVQASWTKKLLELGSLQEEGCQSGTCWALQKTTGSSRSGSSLI